MPVREQQVTHRDPTEPALGALRRAFPWRAVVAPWLLSLSVAVMLAAVNDPSRSRFTQFALQVGRRLLRGNRPHRLRARRRGVPTVGVLPGPPGVIRVLRELGNDEMLIFAVNQLTLLVGLAGVYRIARRYGSPRAGARRVVASLVPGLLRLLDDVRAVAVPRSIGVGVRARRRASRRVCRAAGGGAALLRPNGIVVALSLAVAVSVLRRMAVVVVPALVAVRCGAGTATSARATRWCSSPRRSDGRRSAQWEWSAATRSGRWCHTPAWPSPPSRSSCGSAAGCRPRLLVLTALSLLPALVTGMVGLARYTSECFPPFVAAGQVLERWSTRVQVALLSVSALDSCSSPLWSQRYELVP